MNTEPTVPLDPPTAESAHEATPVSAAPALTAPAPRVRWAGIIWGSVMAAAAASALWFLADPAHYAPLRRWLLTLEPESFQPGWIVGIAIIAVGLLLLIIGAVALLRRAQVRATITH